MSDYTLPDGQVKQVARKGVSIVEIGKVEIFPRGKSVPWTNELAQERSALKQFRQNDRKTFDANPDNIERIRRLDRLEYNYKRSNEMAATLLKAGIPDTPAANAKIIDHLLDVGQNINSKNRVDYRSVISGSDGDVKVYSTWKLTPEGNAYLSSLNLIPKF